MSPIQALRFSPARLLVVLVTLPLSAPPQAQSCASPAAVESLGLATTGERGRLELTLQGAPVVGGNFRVVVERGRSNAPGVLLSSLVEAPRFFPKWGATIFPGKPWFPTSFVTDASGASPRMLQQLPASTALCGVTFTCQAGVIDPVARGGVSLTKALRISFGAGSTGALLEPLAERSTGPRPYDPTLVDMNGDQILDVVFSAMNVPAWPMIAAIEVVPGRGDGTFDPGLTFTADCNLNGMIACGDVDGDGNVDVVSTSTCGTVQLFPGLGDGSLAAPTTVGFAYANEVGITDVSSDGVPDLLLPSSSDVLKIQLGVGDGTFLPPTCYTTGIEPQSVAWGDLTGDGNVDVVTGNRDSDVLGSRGSISILAGRGDGSFEPAVSLAAGGGSSSPDVRTVEVIDLDDDGVLDIAATVDDGLAPSLVSVFRGLGGGAFEARRDFHAVTNHPSDLAAIDLDRDLVLDLVIASSTTGTVEVLFGRGDATFDPVVVYPGSPRLRAFDVGDLDGDQMVDVLVVDSGRNVLTLKNGTLP